MINLRFSNTHAPFINLLKTIFLTLSFFSVSISVSAQHSEAYQKPDRSDKQEPNKASVTSKTIEIRHYQVQDRYTYGAQLLELALSKLPKPYKIIAPESQQMNEARGEIQVIEGALDLQWMSTTTEREEKMIPIKIPIYRWILGLRLMLVKTEMHPLISEVRDIDDLRNFVGGHGIHWGDLPIYAANNLQVKAYVKYESLFEMLKLARFDYFHRGLNEIWDELERHKTDLKIADNIMLFYPLPVYYFVTKSKPELAADLEEGIRKAMLDGSFKQHFLNYHQKFIESGRLESRKLIKLKNPDLPAGTPAIDTSWWLNRDLSLNLVEPYL